MKGDAWRAAALGTALLGVCGCVQPRTEIVARFETDMTQGVNGVLTAIRVRVFSEDESVPRFDQRFEISVGSKPVYLPAYLGMVPRAPDRRVIVEVDAFGGETLYFTRRAIATFAAEKTLLMPVFLADRCRVPENQVCPPGFTCGATGCEAELMDPLEEFDPSTAVPGTPPADGSMDGTMGDGALPDGGADAPAGDASSDAPAGDAVIDGAADGSVAGCVPVSIEICNSADDDCDTMIDEGCTTPTFTDTTPPTTAIIRDVFGTAADEVWVATDTGEVHRWNGTGWVTLPTPPGAAAGHLWASSPTDLWTAAMSGTLSHWNGTTWDMSFPSAAGNVFDIWGASPTSVWAVGGGGTIEHWNGSAWVVETTDTVETIYSVWGSSGTDVYAGSTMGAILRRSGGAWTTEETIPGGGWVRAIAGSGGAMWAGTFIGQIAERDAATGTWTITAEVAGVEGIIGFSPTHAWATGDRGTLMHYNGATWTPVSAGAMQTLYEVWGADASDIWVVGRAGTAQRGP